MTGDDSLFQRAAFLARIVRKEAKYLASTDQRLFSTPFTAQQAVKLDQDESLSEQIDAFVGRFGRLQDTTGDKLLPALLLLLREQPGGAIDNYDRAERLGFIESVDQWLGGCPRIESLLRKSWIWLYFAILFVK
ncbi:MAG: hypothetical protein HN929_00095 [Chloroflexi bacterium]|mgnify:FL=1|nr:hypothetical protein [Chloroflexota bacterium]